MKTDILKAGFDFSKYFKLIEGHLKPQELLYVLMVEIREASGGWNDVSEEVVEDMVDAVVMKAEIYLFTGKLLQSADLMCSIMEVIKPEFVSIGYGSRRFGRILDDAGSFMTLLLEEKMDAETRAMLEQRFGKYMELSEVDWKERI
ncbi:hypothetical protein [Pedobacter frigoris]|uniref:Uncharacterized protein n=1 Tax=Pedobacter frigoris TaxID=2571272 RepID=A0A4U1CM95_9SPHI|nr:hypothetical protein [Pedobacter frigoris]TKC08987.1 hypothetical protein FA047_02510 [Pedobacter frigoris]